MPVTTVEKLTAEAFYKIAENDQELVDGEVKEMPNGGGVHGKVGRKVHLPLANHVIENGLGESPLPSTGYRLRPHTVRKPDASFVAAERWIEPVPKGWLPFAPTLAVEVISPNDTWEAVERKAQEYLDAGTEEVWLVSPFSRKVHIWSRDHGVRVLGESDRLESTELLPGFSVEVRSFFD